MFETSANLLCPHWVGKYARADKNCWHKGLWNVSNHRPGLIIIKQVERELQLFCNASGADLAPLCAPNIQDEFLAIKHLPFTVLPLDFWPSCP